MNHDLDVFERLFDVLEDREKNRPAGSYTTRLLDGGVETIGAKIREEADELLRAAAAPGNAGSDDAPRRELVHEAADLIYHLFVLLAFRRVSLSEVAAELARREGTSGLEEKRSRK